MPNLNLFSVFDAFQRSKILLILKFNHQERVRYTHITSVWICGVYGEVK